LTIKSNVDSGIHLFTGFPQNLDEGAQNIKATAPEVLVKKFHQPKFFIKPASIIYTH